MLQYRNATLLQDLSVIVLLARSSHQDFTLHKYLQPRPNPHSVALPRVAQVLNGILEMALPATGEPDNHTLWQQAPTTFNFKYRNLHGYSYKSINVSVINSTPLVVTNNTTNLCPELH
ncbi:MAG: hypothetical protein IPI98_08990 [Chitinophagaceae bacterium]|nr:hypothetical protein [Chitinophagaceae bacterium]